MFVLCFKLVSYHKSFHNLAIYFGKHCTYFCSVFYFICQASNCSSAVNCKWLQPTIMQNSVDWLLTDARHGVSTSKRLPSTDSLSVQQIVAHCTITNSGPGPLIRHEKSSRPSTDMFGGCFKLVSFHKSSHNPTIWFRTHFRSVFYFIHQDSRRGSSTVTRVV